jgi:hypothetical protein
LREKGETEREKQQFFKRKRGEEKGTERVETKDKMRGKKNN